MSNTNAQTDWLESLVTSEELKAELERLQVQKRQAVDRVEDLLQRRRLEFRKNGKGSVGAIDDELLLRKHDLESLVLMETEVQERLEEVREREDAEAQLQKQIDDFEHRIGVLEHQAKVHEALERHIAPLVAQGRQLLTKWDQGNEGLKRLEKVLEIYREKYAPALSRDKAVLLESLSKLKAESSE